MTKIAKKDKVSVKKVKVKNGIPAKVKKNVSPLPTTTVNKDQEPSKHLLKPRAVKTGVYALLQVIKIRQNEEKKKTLFKDDPKEIMLQIIPIKIPITPMQQIRVVLPHPLTVEGSDVCLITQNVKKATKNDHEPTIAHYKSLLQEKKIKGVTEIVPIRQLRSEHVPYEMKGRFADMYDMFLVDGRLFGKVTKFLGSRFFKKNKDLIPVKINTNNVKEELEKALAKSVLTVHGHGDSYSIKVGFSNFASEQLEANIYAVADVVAKSFPGGFVNIRKVLIKSGHSMAIPIYLSLRPHNSVPVPVVNPRLPKAYAPVEDELSTIPGTRATVLPTGEVILKRVVTEDDIEMGYGFYVTGSEPSRKDDPGEDDEDKEEEREPPKAKGRKRKAGDDEESSDDDVEAAEDAYVLGLHNEPKQGDQGKSMGKAQSKKETVTSKHQAAKAKKQASQGEKKGGKLQPKKLQQINNGEEHSTALNEASDVAGVKGKKSNAKVKKQPEPKEESGMMGGQRKKLKVTPKVEPVEVRKKLELEKKSGGMGLRGSILKATPKAQPGKVKKQVEEDAKVIVSPNMIMKLTPGKEELNASRLKAKKKAVLGKGTKKQLKEDAKGRGSPNTVTKLTSGKEELNALRLKAKKQAALGKGAKKQLKEDAKEMGSPNMIIKLTAGKEEFNASRLKAKKQAALGKGAKKQLKENAKEMGSPNMIMKLTAGKEELNASRPKAKKHAALGNVADALGATHKMSRTSFNGPTEATDLPNDTVTELKKKTKAPKKNPNLESSRLGMLNILKQSKIDNTQNKKVKHSVFNKVGFPENSKLDMQDFDTPVIERSRDKKTKKGADKLTETGEGISKHSFQSVQAFRSPAIETNVDKKKKQDKRATKDKDPTSALQLLDFELPSIQTNTDKKKKRDKRASIGEEISATSVLPIQGLDTPAAEGNAKKKKKKGDKHVKTNDGDSVNSTLRSRDVGTPTIDGHTNIKAMDKQDQPLKIKKSKRLQDKSKSPAIELMPKHKKTKQDSSQDDSLPHVNLDKSLDDVLVGKRKPVSIITRIQPTRSKEDLTEEHSPVKGKPEKIKKRKERSIASTALEESVTTPKPKKKKQSSEDPATNASVTAGAARFDWTVPATVNEPTPSNSEKSSKSKDEAKDKKKANEKVKKENKSPALNSSKTTVVRKSFPRYFSMESQQVFK